MAQFIGTSMPRGAAGQLTRSYYSSVIETKKNDGTAPVLEFGAPVKINDTKDGVAKCTTAEDAGKVYGFAVRHYHQATAWYGKAQTTLQSVVPVMVSGYCAVKVAEGTPKFGDPVYLSATGEVSATAGTEIKNAKFMGEKDAEGLAEISYNV